jgi:hypothetical protein
MSHCRPVHKACVLLLNSTLGPFISSPAYPPFDHNVRDYLTAPFKEEGPALTRQFAFLEALFTRATELLSVYKKGDSAAVALSWYEWMSYGATATNVGTQRVTFYDEVIALAQRVRPCCVFLLVLMGWTVRAIGTCRS